MVQQKSSSASVGVPQNRPEGIFLLQTVVPISAQRQISSTTQNQNLLLFYKQGGKIQFYFPGKQVLQLKPYLCYWVELHHRFWKLHSLFIHPKKMDDCLFCNHLTLLTDMQCVIHYNHLIFLQETTSLVIPYLVFFLSNFCDKLQYHVLVHTDFYRVSLDPTSPSSEFFHILTCPPKYLYTFPYGCYLIIQQAVLSSKLIMVF